LTNITRGSRPIVASSIEVFADVVCPFTHVGLRRLVDRRHDIGETTPLRVRAWPLEFVNGVALAADVVADEVQELREQVAPDLFAGFDATRFPTTSLPALALAAAAYRSSAERGEEVSLALRHALFEEGRNIASDDVLAEIARTHDLAQPDAEDHAAIFADWEEGRSRGVLGSPHFFVDGEGFFCPSLEITRVGDHLRISTDEVGFGRFVSRAFPAAVA
jgi:predicted DsbA family dithiol-disulfide isomerase